MSRTAKAQILSDAQTSTQREQIKSASQRQIAATQAIEQAIEMLTATIRQADQSMSRAESNQAELMRLVEQTAVSLTDLIEESKAAATDYQRGALEATWHLQSATDEARSAATGLEQSIETAGRNSAGRIVQATKRLDQTTKRLRWTIMLMMLSTGAVIGAALLLAFLIWQPDVTVSLWRLATGK